MENADEKYVLTMVKDQKWILMESSLTVIDKNKS